MKAIFKRKKPEQFNGEGLTPELEKAVLVAQIRGLEWCLKETNEANERLLAENKRLIAKNLRLATLAEAMRKEYVKLATHSFGVIN